MKNARITPVENDNGKTAALSSNELESKPSGASTRSSSRNRRKPTFENAHGIVASGSTEISSTNSSLQPRTASLHHAPNQKDKVNTGRDSPFARSSTSVSHDELRTSKMTGRLPSSLSENRTKNQFKKSIRVDAVASILATLDERCYHRTLLQDANSLNQKILMPMSLPWMHPVVPVARNIPCDIDEMPEILSVDDGSHTPFENGPFGFGNFAMGQMQQSADQNLLVTKSVAMRAAARRSVDPGVIELSTVTLHPDEVLKNTFDEAQTDLSCSMDDAVGELSLCCFEIEQKRKKRKIDKAKMLTRKRFISVKINSTSSKFSILPSASLDLACARLPTEVQEARFLSMSKATKIAQKLGSYDCRHGLGPTNASGKNANRVTVGRTRRMWTSKSPADKPQRVFFTSLLTGGRLDSGTQKRPRDIRVAIKVNGEYFQPNDAGMILERRESPGLHAHRVVAEKQCSVDVNKLVTKLIKSKMGEKSRRSLVGMELPLIKPATFDCIPDSTGMISVACTSPGTIPATSVHRLLNNAANEDSAVCTVCWHRGCHELGSLQECSSCGVLAHPNCCLDTGIFRDARVGSDSATAPAWFCSVCSSTTGKTTQDASQQTVKTRRRISRRPVWLNDSLVESPVSNCKTSHLSAPNHSGHKCFLCPFSGGAMSLVKVNGVNSWVHEVCRIWTGFGLSPMDEPTNVSGEDRRIEYCALCGVAGAKLNGGSSDKSPHFSSILAKCAGARCRVYFHPMCALLASKLTRKYVRASMTSTEPSQSSPQMSKDFDISSRFTLTAIDCEAVQKRHGVVKMLQIPVCFCGFHNPTRQADMYGLYPGGEHIDDKVVRVPPHGAKMTSTISQTAAAAVGSKQ
eukprot:scaffold16189_cov125-Cylindrotheca_fusiformis.AAC.1